MRADVAGSSWSRLEGERDRAEKRGSVARLLLLTWRRFNTTARGHRRPGRHLANPGIVSIPLGFIGCWLGTVLSKEETRAERDFDELYVRSETGLARRSALGGDCWTAAATTPRLRRRRPRRGRTRGPARGE